MISKVSNSLYVYFLKYFQKLKLLLFSSHCFLQHALNCLQIYYLSCVLPWHLTFICYILVSIIVI